MEREHDAPSLPAVGVPELDLDAARRRRLRVLVQHAQHLDVLGRPDLEADVLGDEPRQVVELLREDRGRGIGGRGVVAVAAAGVGHRGQQVLVEAVAEADRGRADPGRRARRRRGGRARRASTTPTFASPSVSRRIFRIAPSPGPGAVARGAFSQPPERFVWPPASIERDHGLSCAACHRCERREHGAPRRRSRSARAGRRRAAARRARRRSASPTSSFGPRHRAGAVDARVRARAAAVPAASAGAGTSSSNIAWTSASPSRAIRVWSSRTDVFNVALLPLCRVRVTERSGRCGARLTSLARLPRRLARAAPSGVASSRRASSHCSATTSSRFASSSTVLAPAARSSSSRPRADGCAPPERRSSPWQQAWQRRPRALAPVLRPQVVRTTPPSPPRVRLLRRAAPAGPSGARPGHDEEHGERRRSHPREDVAETGVERPAAVHRHVGQKQAVRAVALVDGDQLAAVPVDREREALLRWADEGEAVLDRAVTPPSARGAGRSPPSPSRGRARCRRRAGRSRARPAGSRSRSRSQPRHVRTASP